MMLLTSLLALSLAPVALGLALPTSSLTSQAATATGAPGPIVKLPEGSYQGSTASGVNSFLGIPFVQPPVGPLRFQLPTTPVATFEGVKQATAYGDSCIQMGTTSGSFGDYPDVVQNELNSNPAINAQVGKTSEDCLTANVVAPANLKPGQLVSVVVWIYGGGFLDGMTSAYRGEPIVARSIAVGAPIVYVSMNYRLNLFGFMSTPELYAEGLGNLGMWDQRFALRWVQDNVHLFGGNKSEVVIWGESAGGNSVALHLIANGTSTDDLYRGAVMQSGSQLPIGDFSHGYKYGAEVTDIVGCTNATIGELACLRTVTTLALKNALAQMPSPSTYQQIQLVFWPLTDGVFVKENQQQLVVDGKYARVPLWDTECEDEGTAFSLFSNNLTTDAEWKEYVKLNWLPEATEEEIDAVALAYPDDPAQGSPYGTGELYNLYSMYKRTASWQGDMYFESGRRLFTSFAAQTQKVWTYLYRRNKFTPVLGAFHSSDLALYYYLGGGSGASGPGGIDYSGLDYLISFVTTLDPNNAANNASYHFWPQYTFNSTDPTAIDQQMLTLDDPVVGSGSTASTSGFLITLDTYRQDAMNLVTKLFLKYPISHASPYGAQDIPPYRVFGP
ncbi:hypothetical protein RQP46_010387 [Phenoliferia psychrophenolica]